MAEYTEYPGQNISDGSGKWLRTQIRRLGYEPLSIEREGDQLVATVPVGQKVFKLTVPDHGKFKLLGLSYG